MNIALSSQTIPIAWQDYLARNFDLALIPWQRYRYSGTGGVEVAIEANTNNLIALELAFLLRGEMKRLDDGGKVYTSGGGDRSDLSSYRLTEYKRGDRLSLVSFPTLAIAADELFDV